LSVIAVVAIGAGVVWSIVGSSSTDEASATTTSVLNTTEVVETTLQDVTTLDGTLGYVEGPAVVNHAVGTLTSAAEPGEIISFGEVLYTVDNSPVVLLEGELPMYRNLQRRIEGSDVEQLEASLVDLGFDPDGEVVVDEEFDYDTQDMVQRWQEEMGLDDTGRVLISDVVFVEEPIRVASVTMKVGQPLQNGVQVILTSGSTTVVSVALDTADQGMVAKGDPVVVVLPDDTRTPATVTSVGTVAVRTQGEGSYFEVEVTLDEPAVAAGLDEAPVSVDVITEEAADVLAVPVSALVALSEGGYAVEVVDSDGSTSLVQVEGGMFADGLVEISGIGISEGTTVVVP
jgi:peptidoglycan hydrolase-like protein with peptidoglycan-binding domain